MRAVARLGDRWHPCFNQVVGDDEGTVGRRIIVLQLPVVRDVRPDALNPTFQLFKDTHIKLAECLTCWPLNEHLIGGLSSTVASLASHRQPWWSWMAVRCGRRPLPGLPKRPCATETLADLIGHVLCKQS